MLQRLHQVAAVVHHAKKGANLLRDGQFLRASSEFHAWGDSNLYPHRHRDALSLTVEHRAAPSPDPIPLTLSVHGDALALAVTDRSNLTSPSSMSLDDRITAVLADSAAPLAVAQLCSLCRVRKAALYRRLAALCRHGILVKSTAGYRPASPPAAASPSRPL